MSGLAGGREKIYAGLTIAALFCAYSFPFIASASVRKVIVLTSGTSWTVPGDWNNYDNKIEAIGGGGGGSNSGGGGGGGGAYNFVKKITQRVRA